MLLYQSILHVTVHWEAIFRPQRNKKFRVHTHMCPNVGVLRLFPSITAATVSTCIHIIKYQDRKINWVDLLKNMVTFDVIYTNIVANEE